MHNLPMTQKLTQAYTDHNRNVLWYYYTIIFFFLFSPDSHHGGHASQDLFGTW